MSKENSSNSGGGIEFFGLLTILFIGLKLTGHLTWSWIWILAPLWLPVSAILAFALFALIMAFIFGQVKK